MDRQELPKTPPVFPKPPLQIPPQMPQNGQPPVPPPKKDKEFNFGKNLLGILASLLVFIGILLTAWASGSRWIQLCGILAAGLFLMLLGMLASRRKSAYRTFFLSVSGCGAGILYLGIMLGYWYYELLSVLGMYALFLLWAGLMYLLSRGKLQVFQNIGHIGMVVAVFSQLDNYTKFQLVSFSDRFSEQANFQLLIMTCYVCISALFYLLTNRQERPEKHLFTLYANGICVGLLGIRILIQADQFYTFFRNGVMHVQTKALSMAVCSLLLAGFLLFQYFWDMHRWLERQKASEFPLCSDAAVTVAVHAWILAEHAVVPRLAGTVRIAARCSVLHRLLVCGTERPCTYCCLPSDVWNRGIDCGGMHSVLRRCAAIRGLVSVPAPADWIRQKGEVPLCHAVFLWAVFAGFMDSAAFCAEWLVLAELCDAV